MTATLWVSAFVVLWLLTIVAAALWDRRRADLPYTALGFDRGDSLIVTTDRKFTKAEIDRLQAEWRRETSRAYGAGKIMLPPGCEVLYLRPLHRNMVGADIGLADHGGRNDL